MTQQYIFIFLLSMNCSCIAMSLAIQLTSGVYMGDSNPTQIHTSRTLGNDKIPTPPEPLYFGIFCPQWKKLQIDSLFIKIQKRIESLKVKLNTIGSAMKLVQQQSMP